MSDHTWTVDVEGVRHTISVERDTNTGRSMIRVDGRMAAKPMSDAETEREISIGSARYVVRRLDDSFDLDIPPEAFLNPRPKTASRAPAKHAETGGGKRIARVLGGIVALIIVAGLIRFGHQGFTYMRVPWKPYSAADATFKANFPGDPAQSEEKININGDLWNFVALEATYKNHYYAVEYVDLHLVVTEQNAPAVLDKFFDGWMSAIGATVLKKESISLSRNPAISFEAKIPKGSGEGEEKLKIDARKRGVIALRDKRIVVASTMAAEADPISIDLTKFLESFEIPPPGQRSRVLTASIDVPPAPAQPIVVTEASAVQSAPAASSKPVLRVYAHNLTRTYYPQNCPGRPADAYPIARSLARSQGFTLAANCKE